VTEGGGVSRGQVAGTEEEGGVWCGRQQGTQWQGQPRWRKRAAVRHDDHWKKGKYKQGEGQGSKEPPEACGGRAGAGNRTWRWWRPEGTSHRPQVENTDAAAIPRHRRRKDHGQNTAPRPHVTPVLAVQPCAPNRPPPTAPQHGAPSQSPPQTHLVHVENQVELAHILKTLVQRLDEHLQQVHDAKR